MGRYGAEAAPVMLVASGVRRQVGIDYSGGDVTIPVTNGLSCNVEGTVVFEDAAGNQATRFMLAGLDYPWEVTKIINAGTTAAMGLNALYSR